MSRVVFVAHVLEPRRGMELALTRLAALLALSHDVEIVVVDPHGQPAGPASVPPGVALRDVSHVRGRVRRWRALRGCLAHTGAGDVVVIGGLWAALPGLPIAWTTGVPTVVWEHSLTQARLATDRRLRLRAEVVARLYRAARLVVAVSPPVRDVLRDRWGIDGVVIADPIGESSAGPVPEAGTGRAGPVIASVGTLNRAKNTHLALRTLQHLPDRWRLVVAGDGPLAAPLRVLATDLGIAARVEWLGDVVDVATVYSRVDVLVHTSPSETFGYTLLEAAAAGVPTVAFEAPVMDRLVPALVPGILVTGADPASWAEAVRAAREVRWDFEAARRRRARQFGDDIVLAQWERVLRQVAEG